MGTLIRSNLAIRRRPDSGPVAATETGKPVAPTSGRLLVVLCLALVLGLFMSRCLAVARTDSITWDEAAHLARGLNLWVAGDDRAMWALGTPRLPHILSGLASFVALRRAETPPEMIDFDAINRLVLSGDLRVLLPARCLAIAWGVTHLLAVYWAAARSLGAASGLVAAALVSMVPEVLAHASIAGSDVPFAASALVALILMARYAERPSLGRWMALATAIGLAWAVRHTAPLLLVLAALVRARVALRPRPVGPWETASCLGRAALASVGLGLVASAVLWAGDGFHIVRPVDIPPGVLPLHVPRRVGPIDISRCPIPTSALAFLEQLRHQREGHEGFFLGEARRRVGWKAYFPVAFLLKTPVGFILLMIMSAARFRPKGTGEGIALAFLMMLWAALVLGKVNIGLRYALLTYPLLSPFVARLFEPGALRDRVWGPATLAATIWFASASFGCHPRYLSYFNEIGGGPQQGWLYLADSNIDWGQDFNALGEALRRLDIREVTTDVSTEGRLVLPGVSVVAFPAKKFQVSAATPPTRRLFHVGGGFLPVHTRYFAISISRFHGLYSHNDMTWLRTRRLVERVGDSIFLFDMDTPATTSFFR